MKREFWLENNRLLSGSRCWFPWCIWSYAAHTHWPVLSLLFSSSIRYFFCHFNFSYLYNWILCSRRPRASGQKQMSCLAKPHLQYYHLNGFWANEGLTSDFAGNEQKCCGSSFLWSHFAVLISRSLDGYTLTTNWLGSMSISLNIVLLIQTTTPKAMKYNFRLFFAS